MTQPYPPGDLEAGSYYYGISSCPRLVARTSSDPFVLRIETQHPVPKRFDPVGSHKIVSLWNNDGPLRTQILEVVEELQWNAIDILRLGYDPDDKPVTMLISIDSGSADWSTAIRVALRCREILCRHGVELEVEIKESRIFPAVGHHPLTSDPVEEPEEATIHHSEMIGTSIATGKNPDIEGTKGVYLRLKSGDILSLTCRHVIFNGEPNLEYRHQDSAPRTVIQPGNTTLEMGIERVKDLLDNREMDAANRARKMDLDAVAAEKNRLKALLARMEGEKTSVELRRIGHVRFSPKYAITKSHGLQRFRDWALIELYQDKHQTPIEALKNVAWAEDCREAFRVMAKSSRKSVKEIPFTIQYEDNNRVKLEGHFTDAELQKPHFESPGLDLDLDVNIMVVAKYGQTTGFSFSNKGDSGACIWDMQGRAVGMIIAGVGSPEAREQTFDVTYVTPMEWLLEDIRAHGFDVEVA
ncbi:hypothetical protein DER45DRAFT_620558 [Fusarium avenaceum]|nr:hypothetical protein DER45DRAFT_620558 [Fusarium avenaceum]